jgi:hypothetical protein
MGHNYSAGLRPASEDRHAPGSARDRSQRPDPGRLLFAPGPVETPLPWLHAPSGGAAAGSRSDLASSAAGRYDR